MQRCHDFSFKIYLIVLAYKTFMGFGNKVFNEMSLVIASDRDILWEDNFVSESFIAFQIQKSFNFQRIVLLLHPQISVPSIQNDFYRWNPM